jgi:hypothetical protein
MTEHELDALAKPQHVVKIYPGLQYRYLKDDTLDLDAALDGDVEEWKFVVVSSYRGRGR